MPYHRQEWHDDLDVETALEQIKQGSYRRLERAGTTTTVFLHCVITVPRDLICLCQSNFSNRVCKMTAMPSVAI